MPEEGVAEMRLTQHQAEIDSHAGRARLSLLRQSIIILISSMLFFIHWRLAKNIDNKEELLGNTT